MIYPYNLPKVSWEPVNTAPWKMGGTLRKFWKDFRPCSNCIQGIRWPSLIIFVRLPAARFNARVSGCMTWWRHSPSFWKAQVSDWDVWPNRGGCLRGLERTLSSTKWRCPGRERPTAGTSWAQGTSLGGSVPNDPTSGIKELSWPVVWVWIVQKWSQKEYLKLMET